MHIAVTYFSVDCLHRATQLAEELQLPLFAPSAPLKLPKLLKQLTSPEQLSSQNIYDCSLNCLLDYFLLLVVTPSRLELHQITKRTKPLCVDFLSHAMLYRLQHGGGFKRNQLLAKAVGIKGKDVPTVLDATAGLGKDAFILAALGCRVHMLERSPIVGALLQDGLAHLKRMLALNVDVTNANFSEDEKLLARFFMPKVLRFLPSNFELNLTITSALDYIEQRLHELHLDKSIAQLPPNDYGEMNALNKNGVLECAHNVAEGFDFGNDNRPDVVYLDPMYPEESGENGKSRSALNKEEMRILKMIVGNDQDADELFARALQLARKRVVVKRPKHAPHIAGKKPHITFAGSSSRMDVYLLQGNQ